MRCSVRVLSYPSGQLLITHKFNCGRRGKCLHSGFRLTVSTSRDARSSAEVQPWTDVKNLLMRSVAL